MSGIAVQSERPQLRAPSADGGTLIAPPLSDLADVLGENRARRATWQYDVQGRSLADLARRARGELLQAALAYTGQYRDVPRLPDSATAEILLAGHQPELFHPGVWLKNFALGKMAESREAVGINLLIDNDTMKQASLPVPTGTPKSPRLISVPFDRGHDPLPFEERPIIDGDLFRSFGARAVEAIRSLVPHPLVESFWPLACERARAAGNLGLAVAQARHIVESRWCLSSLEVPQSRVCAAESFRWFTAHLLAQLPEFRHRFNEAVGHYRRRHGLRSAAHPFPDLAKKDGWLEAPFWIWTTAEPRRRALFATQRDRRVVIADGETFELELPLTPEGDGAKAVERLGELEAAGIKIRSRALTTTLWARLVLSDLFVHGIGGAKYDEVTDRLFTQFFGLTPPELMVVSGTLRLPVPAPNVSPQQEGALKQRLWQLRHHPEKFLEDHAEVRENHRPTGRLVDEKRRWIQTSATRENARERCRAIRRINASLQPYVAGERCRTAERMRDVERVLAAAGVLSWREFSFCLHPEVSLQRFLCEAGLPGTLDRENPAGAGQ